MLKFFVPSREQHSEAVIGVDLGGTNVRACAYAHDGTPLGEKFAEKSHAQSGSAAIFDAIASVVSKAKESAGAEISLVGMAIPGIVDNVAGKVFWAPNFGETVDGVFRFWEDIDVRAPLEKRLGLPFALGNDANLAALGEYRFGAGKGTASCLVMLTVGTGIGGGVILSSNGVTGKAEGPLMLMGGNKGGIELGHTVLQKDGLDSSAGVYGTLEAYCQRDAIVRRAAHRLLRGRKSVLTEMVNGDYGQLTPLHLSKAAAQGDALAIEVWAEVGEILGTAIGSFINIFNPDLVTIGGQIAKVGDFLLEPARRAAENTAIPNLFKYAKIVQAEQIDDAGLLGGAALALETLKWN